jgi:hypothetical protein
LEGNVASHKVGILHQGKQPVDLQGGELVLCNVLMQQRFTSVERRSRLRGTLWGLKQSL